MGELPETYRGYSTKELLEIQEALSTSPMTERLKEILRKADTQKTFAAQNMVWEYRLTGAARISAKFQEEFQRRRREKEEKRTTEAK